MSVYSRKADQASILAQQLRRLRKQRKITVQDLSLRSGVCRATIGAIENGRNSNPTQQTVEALARALKAPLAELLIATHSSARLSEESDSFHHLSQGEQDALARMKNDNPDIFYYMLKVENLPPFKQDALYDYLEALYK